MSGGLKLLILLVAEEGFEPPTHGIMIPFNRHLMVPYRFSSAQQSRANSALSVAYCVAAFRSYTLFSSTYPVPNVRFTDISLRSLAPPERGQVDYWDELLPCFGCRVSQGGTMTFILKKDNRRISIGRFPIISLAQARTEAKRLLAEHTLGQRPAHPHRSRSRGSPRRLRAQEPGPHRRGLSTFAHQVFFFQRCAAGNFPLGHHTKTR